MASLTVLSSSLFSIAVLTCALHLATSAQAQDRVLEWFQKREAPEVKVLEIVEIKVEGKPVEIGQRFTAGKDWLKSLTFKVKNVSAKPVRVFNLSFVIPEIKNNNKEVILGMTYGIGETGVRRNDSETFEPIRPAEEADLVIPKRLLEYLQHYLAEHNATLDINRVDIYPEAILTFEDSSSARGGFLIR